MSGLAQRMFDAESAQSQTEMEAYEFLNEVLGEGTHRDWTSDYYDRSIEIFSVTKDLILSPEQQARFWAEGFDRVWTHEAAERSDNETGERFYAKPT